MPSPLILRKIDEGSWAGKQFRLGLSFCEGVRLKSVQIRNKVWIGIAFPLLDRVLLFISHFCQLVFCTIGYNPPI